ncbi:ATP synthase subunit d, mitochondrial [Macrobrachium rosenbergii]|uniref:ATP synthase subunit d, mitochondrial n=1 Tax=Macrobrachium rosenbergii TaxID=79674 RepID=UPI0034D3CAD5
MAAKRVAASAVDWAAFAARVPEAQKPMFNAFKGKSDAFLRKVLSLPEASPKINFAEYKARIAIPGMVDEFQKQYDALKIPYPADTVSSEIDAVEKEAAAEVQGFIKASNDRIATLQADLVRWEGMIPYDQMTMEEWAEAFPEQSISATNPTMWPHLPEDQPGYVTKDAAESHH